MDNTFHINFTFRTSHISYISQVRHFTDHTFQKSITSWIIHSMDHTFQGSITSRISDVALTIAVVAMMNL